MRHKFVNVLLLILILLYITTLVCCTDDGRINTHASTETNEAESHSDSASFYYYS